MSNKKQQVSQAKSFTTGLQEHGAKMSFIVDDETYTTPQVVKVCTALVSADDATVQAKAAYTQTLAAERKLLATAGPVLKAVKQQVVLTFGGSPTTLATFGVTAPRKPTPLTGEAIVAKAAKAAATRAARGTTSKKQKATVSGNVSGVTITPNVVGASAPAATPNASAPPATPASSIAVAAGGTPTHS